MNEIERREDKEPGPALAHLQGMREAADLIRHLSPEAADLLLDTIAARALRVYVEEWAREAA